MRGLTGPLQARTLQIFSVVAAAYMLLTLATFPIIYSDFAHVGKLKLRLGSCGADRVCEVVRSAGAPAAAGIRPGDKIRFDRSGDALRFQNLAFVPGDRISVTTGRAGGPSRHVEVAPEPGFWTHGNLALQISDEFGVAVSILIVLVSLFALSRAGGRLAIILLSTGLVCAQTNISGVPFFLWGNPLAFRVLTALDDSLAAAAPLFLAAFAQAFRDPGSSRDRSLSGWLFWGLVAVTAGWRLLAEALIQTDRLTELVVNNPYGLTPASWISFILSDAAYVLTLAFLVAGWRAAPRSERARYVYIVPAVAFLATAQILEGFPALTGGWDPTRNPVVVVLNLAPPACLLLLVYAVLRHRVMDLGLAVNRTLVYAIVSAILLTAFGLIEWAVDHFLPIASREKNALIDAAVAVGVFLTFHRVRDVVEHAVEGLFFRRWQRAEQALRRFVREAAFITEPDALAAAFAAALSRFTEGAEVAVFVKEGRDYVLQAGALTRVEERLAPNLPALVSLRADLKPVEVEEEGFGVALLAPMVTRNELTGFAAVGPKVSGDRLRPDEIELIGWAGRQVGLDLHALRIEALETALSATRAELNGVLKMALKTA